MVYDNKPLFNFLQVQILVTAYNNKYYFPDTPQLRNKSILALEFYGENSGLVKDINNVGLVSTADMKQYFLTLVSNDVNKVEKVPLTKLINVANALPNRFGNIDGLMTFDNLTGVDLSKSYVEATPLFLPTTPLPFSICFGVFYK